MVLCAAGSVTVTPCGNFLQHNTKYADCTNIGVSDKINDMIDTNVTTAYHTTPHTEEICSTPGNKIYFRNIHRMINKELTFNSWFDLCKS